MGSSSSVRLPFPSFNPRWKRYPPSTVASTYGRRMEAFNHRRTICSGRHSQHLVATVGLKSPCPAGCVQRWDVTNSEWKQLGPPHAGASSSSGSRRARSPAHSPQHGGNGNKVMPVMLTIDSNEEHFARCPYHIRRRECMVTLNWKDPGSLFYVIQLDKRYHRKFLAGAYRTSVMAAQCVRCAFERGELREASESGNGLCDDCDYIKNRVPVKIPVVSL